MPTLRNKPSPTHPTKLLSLQCRNKPKKNAKKTLVSLTKLGCWCNGDGDISTTTDLQCYYGRHTFNPIPHCWLQCVSWMAPEPQALLALVTQSALDFCNLWSIWKECHEVPIFGLGLLEHMFRVPRIGNGKLCARHVIRIRMCIDKSVQEGSRPSKQVVSVNAFPRELGIVDSLQNRNTTPVE